MGKVLAAVLSTVLLVGCGKEDDGELNTRLDSHLDQLAGIPAEKYKGCVNGIEFSLNRKTSASENWAIYDEFYRLAKSEETRNEALGMVMKADGSLNAVRELLYARPDIYAQANIDSVSTDVFLWGNYQLRDITYNFKGKSLTQQQSTHCAAGRCMISSFPMDIDQSHLASVVSKNKYSECDIQPEFSVEFLADDTINPITVSIDQGVIKQRDNSWGEEVMLLCSDSSDSALCNGNGNGSIETYKISGGDYIVSLADAGVIKSYLREGHIKKSYEVTLGEKRFLFAHLITRNKEDHIIMWQYNAAGELTADRSTAWELDEMVFRQPELLTTVFDISPVKPVETAVAKTSSLPEPSYKAGKRNYFEGVSGTFNFTHTFSVWNEETNKLEIYHTLTELEDSEKLKITNGEDAFFVLVAKQPPPNGKWTSYPYVWVELEFKSNDIQKKNIAQASVGTVGVKQGGSTTFAETGTQIEHIAYENQKVSLQYSGQRVLSGEAYSWNFDY